MSAKSLRDGIGSALAWLEDGIDPTHDGGSGADCCDMAPCWLCKATYALTDALKADSDERETESERGS